MRRVECAGVRLSKQRERESKAEARGGVHALPLQAGEARERHAGLQRDEGAPEAAKGGREEQRP